MNWVLANRFSGIYRALRAFDRRLKRLERLLMDESLPVKAPPPGPTDSTT